MNSICIIGLGTVGGFLAKNVSMLETTKKLVLIDYDIVEPGNLRNSIYEEKDQFEHKCVALKKKIERSDLEVQIIKKEFIEGETKIPECDLVIDCRDVTYDRLGLIDARLYISYDKLIIDCRKEHYHKEKREGQYLTRLTKTQINYATNCAAMLIEDGTFRQLIEKQRIHNIPIYLISEEAKMEISKNLPDIIYDKNLFGNRITNLKETYPEIIDINKTKDLVVYVGGKNNPCVKKVYPVHNLETINDITKNFESLISPYQFNYYVIYVSIYNNYVEILPETGSA